MDSPGSASARRTKQTGTKPTPGPTESASEPRPPRPRLPDFPAMTQALMHRHERRAAIDVTVRANLNEALAALLIASHTQKLTCVAVSQAWDHALERLDNPFQDEVRRWVDEHDRYYTAS